MLCIRIQWITFNTQKRTEVEKNGDKVGKSNAYGETKMRMVKQWETWEIELMQDS